MSPCLWSKKCRVQADVWLWYDQTVRFKLCDFINLDKKKTMSRSDQNVFTHNVFPGHMHVFFADDQKTSYYTTTMCAINLGYLEHVELILMPDDDLIMIEVEELDSEDLRDWRNACSLVVDPPEG